MLDKKSMIFTNRNMMYVIGLIGFGGLRERRAPEA